MNCPPRLLGITSDICTFNALAREATEAVQDEFQAVERLYTAILERYHQKAVQSRVSQESPTNDEERREEWSQTVSPVTRACSPDGPSDVQGQIQGEEYIQIIVDCTSLKFIIDSSKRGYQSGGELIVDLGEVVDRFLSDDEAEGEREAEAGSTGMLTPKAGVSFDTDRTTITPSEQPTIPETKTCRGRNHTQLRKRFTFLIDPIKMVDKNYPLRKEKARTFIAGLDDVPGSELVHVGIGRKSVEERLEETTKHHLSIAQCAHVFLAVGITSNNHHHVLNLSRPTLQALAAAAGPSCKLTVMRSGGPFDRTLGIGCVPIDRYLSVQVQVPGAAAGGFEHRERRSFAPSPAGGSRRVLEDGVGQGKGKGTVVPLSALLAVALGDDGPEGDGGREEGYEAPPRADTGPPQVLATFDPQSILAQYGKPLCAKYHLNHGRCYCAPPLLESLHDEVVLESGASKQLAVWAADRACPEGPGCPDAKARKCCFWFHEPVAAQAKSADDVAVGGKEDVEDEWISVDKKGKPILTKNVHVPRAWQPSTSSISAGKLVRNDFHPLLTIIQQFDREKHEYKHERGLIGTELKRSYGHDLYRRLGVSGFREYTALAEKAGLVRLGYHSHSSGWIALA